MSNFFHNHCNITDRTYKGVGRWEGGGGGSGWEAGGGLYLPIELFGVSVSQRSASHRPRQAWRALRDVSLTQGWKLGPYLPSSVLHGSHCLSHDFTWLAKPALEKQTSKLSLLMQQCTGSVWVWLLAEPIKCNWPSVTLWLVFQYPVTNCSTRITYCMSEWSIVSSTKLACWLVLGYLHNMHFVVLLGSCKYIDDRTSNKVILKVEDKSMHKLR